jgi:tetratricopeptide (TPR) repeat protein
MSRKCCLICLYIVCACCDFVVCGNMNAWDSVDGYKDYSKYLSAEERLKFARESITASQEEAVLGEAVQDLLKYGAGDEWNGKNLSMVENVIDKFRDKTSECYQELVLAKGKLLSRLGRCDESSALFDDAVKKKWPHAMWRYSESMIDRGDLDKAALLEYNRICSKEEIYNSYRGERENLFIFITLLHLMKKKQPDKSAMEFVFSNIDSEKQKDWAVEIVKSHCLMEDGRNEEALNLMQEVDSNLKSNSIVSTDRNYLSLFNDIPYHLTSLYISSKNRVEAKKSFTIFIDRNKNDMNYVISNALRLCRDFEINMLQLPNTTAVTGSVIDSGILDDPKAINGISESDIASIYDLYQQGLACEGHGEKVRTMCKFVMDRYYPQTLAGANCAMNYARIILWCDPNVDEAERIFKNILLEAPYKEITPWVKLNLAELYAIAKDDPQKGLSYIQEVKELLKNERGAVLRCYDAAVKLEKKILGKKPNN